MIEALREKFNSAWTPAKYAEFQRLFQQRTGEACAFRLNETPCFLPVAMFDQMALYGQELVQQLLDSPQYQQDATARAIPPEYNAPNEAPYPLFVQADFGLVKNAEGGYDPKLVEIQGFPSLYGLQPVMATCYRDAYDIDAPMLPGGRTVDEYNALLREAIVGDADPTETVLLEVDPWNQKTRSDFRITEQVCGIRVEDIRDVRKQGRKLVAGGRPISRIYNRTIVDELVRRNIELQFDFRDDLDVEWAGHPNWYFRLSKFSLPYFKHVSVPESKFLSDVKNIPADTSGLVLKPLFSFAGLGVMIGPTREQILAVPDAQKAEYLLQDKVSFSPSVKTPHGETKVEVRIMYIWRQGKLEPVNTIIRMGRGAMMGVDHNKNMEWVGASAAFVA